GARGYRAAARFRETHVEEAADLEGDYARVAAVGVAIGERHLLDLDHVMDQLGASPLELLHIETRRDGELFEQDVPLGHRRLSVHGVSAVRDARWRGTVGLMGGEIFRADRSADLADRRCEALGERPFVEDRRALRGDLAQGRREVGLLQDLAGAREPTPRAEDARGLRVEPSTAIDEALREP